MVFTLLHTVTFNDFTSITTVAYIVSLCELNCSIQSFVETMLDAKDDCCTQDKSDRMKAFSEIMALYDILTKSFYVIILKLLIVYTLVSNYL